MRETDSTKSRWPRIVWTAGFLLMLTHVLCAFGFYRQWSHQLAYQHTAEQTAKMTGLKWGGGIYFNELLLLIWLMDLIRMWTQPPVEGVQRGPWFWSLHGYFAFMMFNATVVFGPVYWRWVLVAGCLVGALIFRSRR